MRKLYFDLGCVVSAAAAVVYGQHDADGASGKVAMPNVVSFDVVNLPLHPLRLRIHHPNHYHNQQAGKKNKSKM